MKFILGKKLEMSQVYGADGNVIPITLVQAGSCVVTQVKQMDQDGYSAVQIGFLPIRKLTKPEEGHLKDLPKLHHLCEFRVAEGHAFKRGDVVEANVFQIGDLVQVSGVSKGKGFQGVVKRHHFHGHPTSHGHKDQTRMPGSIGAGGVQHVLKGRRMAGRMGNERVTVKNLRVVDVRDGGIIALKGAVPGARNAILEMVAN
ncbi:MAG: 50S ribosomal protein L3 [Candidatus Uhrbacteria bacterium]|nr:50S ribosomal protein L3 [Candidatus Uhrbacteria bacterium]